MWELGSADTPLIANMQTQTVILQMLVDRISKTKATMHLSDTKGKTDYIRTKMHSTAIKKKKTLTEVIWKDWS